MAGALRLSFRLQGSQQVREALLRVAAQAPSAVGRALYRTGAAVWAEASIRAPLKYGALRHSGYVVPPRMEDGQPLVEVGFGVEYAIYQHEGNFHHPRGGQRYFLRTAVADKVDVSQLAAWAREYLERGSGAAVPAVAPVRPAVAERARNRAAVRRAGQRVRKRGK